MSFTLSSNMLTWLTWFIRVCYSIYLLICVLDLESVKLKVAVALSCLIMELTVIRFLRNWHMKRQPLLLDWFRLATFIFLVLNFQISIFDFDAYVYTDVLNSVYVESEAAFPAILTILMGILALDLGAIIAKGIFLKSSLKFSSKRTIKKFKFRNIKVFYGLTLLIGIIQTILVLSGYVGFNSEVGYRVSGISFLLIIVETLGPLILLIYASLVYLYELRNQVFRTFFLLQFLFQIGYGFLSGMKEAIIIPILLVVIPYVLSGRKVKKTIVATSIVFVIVLYPVINNYRQILSYGQPTSKVSMLSSAIETTLDNGFVENFATGTDSYSSRIALFPVLMYSIENEDFWREYKYLNRYIYLPVAWAVPRIFLPSKPISNTGGKLYYATTGITGITSITPSTYGWSYFEGGYLPTILSFLLFGLFITVYQLKLSNRFHHVLLYILVLVSLLKVEADIYFKITEILQTTLIILIANRILFKTSRNSNADTFAIQKTNAT